MKRLTLLSIATIFASGLSACQSETTGRCCTALSDEAKADIPVPDGPEVLMGKPPRDIFAENTRFDCDTEFCVSAAGSEAFCTRKCNNEDCPEGFDCLPVLESASCDYDMRTPETEDDCPIGSTTPLDKFCVRKRCSSASDCPDDFECQVVHAGSMTEDDPEIRQCVKIEHTCAEVNKE